MRPATLGLALLLTGCGQVAPSGHTRTSEVAQPRRGLEVVSQSEVHTLYREASTPDRGRVHVATFNAAENGEYNRDVCFKAQGLFQQGARERYWCERGAFQP